VKKLLLASAFALSVSGANAETLTLGVGTFSDASCTPVCTGSFGPTAAETGTISDTYSFDVSAGSVLLHTASATNSTTQTGEEISNFAIALFSGTPASPGTEIATGVGATSTPTEQTTGGLPLESLAAGLYFLELTGLNGGVPTTYAGSFSFTPTSAVPLPGALVLFGTGLGMIGLFKKKLKRSIWS
jgi:hypothetical protein